MNIVFVGLAGVPYRKRACDTRLLSFAKIFISNGHVVNILNRMPSNKIYNTTEESFPPEIKIVELFKVKKTITFPNYLIYTLISIVKESKWLIIQNKKDNIDILHVYTGHYFEFIRYHLIAKIIKAKVIYQYVEVRSSMNRNGLYHKLNGFLCDRFGYKLFDGIISISNYIDQKIKQQNPKLPTIKVPPICDFEYFQGIVQANSVDNYILYCGSVEYLEVITFIIESYYASNCKSKNVKLVLIVSGSLKKIDYLTNLVQSDHDITIKTNLVYDDLIRYYKNALALLIPIRNTTQDIARFPNKICEYSASENIIVTTNFGEIPYYFKNRNNALIADTYTVQKIADEINWLLNHMQSLIEIKKNAFSLGKEYFDIRSYKDKLNEFLTIISLQ